MDALTQDTEISPEIERVSNVRGKLTASEGKERQCTPLDQTPDAATTQPVPIAASNTDSHSRHHHSHFHPHPPVTHNLQEDIFSDSNPSTAPSSSDHATTSLSRKSSVASYLHHHSGHHHHGSRPSHASQPVSAEMDDPAAFLEENVFPVLLPGIEKLLKMVKRKDGDEEVTEPLLWLGHYLQKHNSRTTSRQHDLDHGGKISVVGSLLNTHAQSGSRGRTKSVLAGGQSL